MPTALTPAVLGLLLVTAGGAMASQSVAVLLEVGNDLPFTGEMLRHAVSIRLPQQDVSLDTRARDDGIRVQVRRADAGAVLIVHGHKQRRLMIAELPPQVAARWVALAITDIIRSDMVVPVTLPSSPVAKPRGSGPGQRVIGLIGRGGSGSNLDLFQLGLALDGSLKILSAFHGVVAAGVVWSQTSETLDQSAQTSLTMLDLRTGLGWVPSSVPRLQARITFLLLPYWLAGQTEVTQLSHQGVLGGAGAALFYGVRITAHLEGALGLGADLLFNRASFEVRGVPVQATERVMFWAALGVRVRL